MILVDDRTGSRDLIKHLGDDGAVLCRLDNDEGKAVGDAALTGYGPDGSTISIGVELKKIDDLLSSISSGRLGGTQLPRMLRHWDHVWVLFYGEYRPGHTSNLLQVHRWRNDRPTWLNYRVGRREVPWAYLEGALITYSMLAGVRVKHAQSISEAARWLTVLDHWLTKPWDKHRAMAVFDRSRELSAPPDADPVEEQIARTAASFPAVDWVRGWSAARHFDSVEDMVMADRKDWEGIRGIGPVIADSVVRAIRTKKDSRSERERERRRDKR